MIKLINMNRDLLKTIFAPFFIFQLMVPLTAETVEVVIDSSKVFKENHSGFSGVNLCWLTDSDQNWKRPTSMVKALKEMGVGALRFPYGHLADYYVWHSGKIEDIEDGGLKPVMKAMPPYLKKWTWAFNEDGTMKKAMNFDEYISMCKKLNVKPLVVVNTLSMHLKGGPSREETIKKAAEWVRYASKKDYQVAYWSIGNEVDHGVSKKNMDMESYFDLYVDIVKAMKNENPAIKVGPGILGNKNYFDRALKIDSSLIDFSCVHQYMFPFRSDKVSPLWKTNSLKAWQATTQWKEFGNLNKAAAFYSKIKDRDFELLVTETGITGSPERSGSVNNLWKSLWWFEVLMHQLAMKGVSYSFYWGTHSPWSGGTEDDMKGKDDGVLLRLDNNKRKPTGEIIRMVNNFFFSQMLEVKIAHGDLRLYASKDRQTGHLALFILNKGDEEVSFRPLINEVKGSDWHHYLYAGVNANDTQPKLNHLGKIKSAKTLEIRCPGLSLSILRQEPFQTR
jgi:alpha-L-arabinofuranosidase